MLISTHIAEVFKTNVDDTTKAKELISILHTLFTGSRVTFDLEDCDRVLRVEHEDANTEIIKMVLHGHGFACEELQ